jgi:hypothetical protein
MKKVLILLALLLALALSALPAAAITGGVEDGDGHPNVGLMIADIDGEPVWRCSGTLIAPRVFLTAGHCTGDGATGARVWFDSDLSANPEYPYSGETSYEGTPIAHPDYIWSGSDFHDVGVVILDQPVTDIEPASLAQADLLTDMKKERVLESGYEEGIYFRSVGYGVVLKSWPPPVLSAGNETGIDKIRMVSESEFASLTKSLLHLFQRAVFEESGACFGDSGGPVFWIDDEGNEFVVAVTSSGDAYCLAASFRYRVDVPEIQDWIYSQFPDD